MDMTNPLMMQIMVMSRVYEFVLSAPESLGQSGRAQGPLQIANTTGQNGEAHPTSDFCDWADAQANEAVSLAQTAAAFGALDERLANAPAGYRLRLAIAEASAQSGAISDPVSVERIALWHGEHLAGQAAEVPPLVRAGQAARALLGPVGRPDTPLHDDIGERRNRPNLHPISRAARHFWQRIDSLPDPAPTQVIEGAVHAARVAAADARGGATFLPLAIGGTLDAVGLMRGLPHRARLQSWLAGAEEGCLAALARIDQLNAWQQRADRAIDALSGRTPGRLVAVFATWPVVSARMAEEKSAVSRAAVQRNIDRLVDAGLIREITGQGRYRLWAALL